MSGQAQSTVDEEEIAQFAAIADEWWDEDGKLKPLHRLNPVRIGYIRDTICRHADRDHLAPSPLIGWVIGAFVRTARRWSSRARSLLAIPTFFLAVWLFGVAAAVPVVVASPGVPSAEDLLRIPASFVVGVVGYHLWVVLIPLAIVNTRILLRLESDRAASTP